MDITKKSVYLFGDSIGKGIVLDEIIGKYTTTKNNFAEFAANYLGVTLKNKSMFGCTISKGRDLIARLLESKSDINDIDYVFLEFGGNDCDFNWKEVSNNPQNEHSPKTSLIDFVNIYSDIILNLKSREITPVLMTLPPIASDLYFNWISRGNQQKNNILDWLNGDIENIYYWHERYNSAVWEVGNNTKSYVLDIRKSFLEDKNYKRFICSDGIHLNSDGHKLVANTILETITQL